VITSADIAILVRVADERITLELESPRAGALRVPLGITVSKLQELRRGLATGLQGFVALLAQSGRVTKDAALAERAIRRLYAVGATLGFGMFRTLTPAIEQYFRAAWPGWAMAGQEGYVPPRVELVGSFDFPLPLEFVPLFDTREPGTINVDNLVSIAARFPVFSTIFCRAPSDRALAAAPDVIENASALLVRLFLHAGLLGAKAECKYLQSAPGVLLRGPWPNQLVSDTEFVRQLSTQMWRATHADDTQLAGTPDHIQHYVCHCDTDKPQSLDYTLTLAHESKIISIFSPMRPKSVSLAQLQANFFGQQGAANPGPLVFLNACGSSKVTAEGVASFPGLFLDIGSRAVIGTEIAIPDFAAAAFARAFYTKFLEGFPLGEALYEARMQLLRDRFNPIGALYSAYANPDLRLRKPTQRPQAA
jgi:hypothetical protein